MRLSFLIALIVSALFISCNSQPDRPQVMDLKPSSLPALQPGEAVATFAGGCFWSMQEEMRLLKGVRQVVSGYAGGDVEKPTYEQVSSDQTGHAEAIQVYYDPKVLPYDKLLDAFFAAHDATTLNRQGPDVGKHYRSIAFYRTPAEKTQIEAAIRREDASDHHQDPVVTQVTALDAFYPAEGYHQDYYRQNPYNMYVATVCRKKVGKFKDRMSDYLKKDVD
ncbi:peptide-methionine (S)-S-oxide reductase MsrA [Spirosoma sp. KUDC1026]|uniref:peptide-methionine (S)-S-oxide reductase MsrA n=1 Tax=Spirosoma sp. KUDC1026 TaxID=2745947 RepID=UPI00159B920E|nr:peptide-methionine (S)-S-oxide reductase MsrA [Spirosoma sp. KUDC1026]QKZ13592.1 peptide-methionine (S)-S-oxide reductase MsrA [Spirosoma sp. KUDC1026]